MTPLNPSTVTLLVLVPLIAWRMYSRFRRMVGRQRLSRVRPWITLTIFPALILFIGLATLSHPQRLPWLAAGLLAGALLGVFGLGKTRFEPTPQGLFYTPNAHLGIALSLLFVARIAYRFIEIYAIDPTVPHGMDDFARSPLTLAVFGLLAGYYVAYAIGLLRWRFRVLRAKREREAAQAAAAPMAATAPPEQTSGEAG
jgi:cytochrome b561